MHISRKEYLEAFMEKRPMAPDGLHTLEGTVQRVNYRLQELTVVAQCQIWQFQLADECQLYFDNEKVILRCFHPLDHIKILYAPHSPKNIAMAIYAWEQKAAA